MDVSGSVLEKFADDTKWARVVETEEDKQKFQEGVDGLERWSKDWQLLFNARLYILGPRTATSATP